LFAKSWFELLVQPRWVDVEIVFLVELNNKIRLLAASICDGLLDVFDPSGDHC
jgi:hypothetical protein